MNFCPQCGTRFEPQARFCQECGFDINSVLAINELIPKSIIESPVVETSVSAAQAEILPTASGPILYSSDENTQTVKPGKPIKLRNRRTLWPWVLLLMVALVAAGWFVYKMYLLPQKDVPDEVVENIIVPENKNAENTESNTKTMSLMDQELAKQKEKVQIKSDQQNLSDKPGNGSENIADIDIVSKVILEIGHKEDANNKNPKNSTKLTLKKPTMITRITTDHYNDGMGTPRGGKITIKDGNNTVKGSYKALGMTGKNGTPSAKWVVEPNIMLEKGTYFILDSDPSTWSKTFVGGNGYVVVEGYEVE
jgi:hypothetical protein